MGSVGSITLTEPLMEQEMRQEFDSINDKIDKFMSKKSGTLEIDDNIIEKHSVKELVDDYVREFNDGVKQYGDGTFYTDIHGDTTVAIMYKDGTLSFSSDWEVDKLVKTTGIDSVIVNSDWGTAIAGKNIVLENYREITAYNKDLPVGKRYGYKSVTDRYNDFNDIRADFKYIE